MTKKIQCPDCGVAVGQPHQNECDIELCSTCGGQRISCDCETHDPLLTVWTGNWPESEDAEYGVGFVIYDSVAASFPKTETKETPSEKVVVPPWPDEGWSANCRLVRRTYIAEPIYKDGKPTGEWRVCRRRRHWPEYLCSLGRNVPWEHVFPNEEAMEEWEQSLSGEKER
jgi:hypothetical protein